MFDDIANELLARYRRDRSSAAYEELAAAAIPIIRSICRRYFRDPADIDDAQQQVLIKLHHHVDRINTNLVGWLSSTTRTTCIDSVRAAAARRSKHQQACERSTSPYESLLRWEAARAQLGEALSRLDQTARHLLVDCFLHGRVLHQMAADLSASPSTVHRHLRRAIGELGAVYRELGYGSPDDVPSDCTVAPAGDPGLAYHRDDGLRMAADWNELTAELRDQVEQNGRMLEGWSRPLRVGVLVSRRTTTQVNSLGAQMHIERQLECVELPQVPGYQFVAIIEPGTDVYAEIERTIRRYHLLNGVVDATDTQALETLDVIVTGNNHYIDAPVLRAFYHAVRSGVGFYSQGWLGMENERHSRELQSLMLAQGPAGNYHHPRGCGSSDTHTVHHAHPAMGPLRPGEVFRAPTCGLWTRPAPGARVLMTSQPRADVDPILPRPMSTVRAGQIGRGRVLVCAPVSMLQIARRFRPHGSADRGHNPGFLGSIIHWLAQPGAAAQSSESCRAAQADTP
jgi:RNA polymerase sigma factor (sigma-70 family)